MFNEYQQAVINVAALFAWGDKRYGPDWPSMQKQVAAVFCAVPAVSSPLTTTEDTFKASCDLVWQLRHLEK